MTDVPLPATSDEITVDWLNDVLGDAGVLHGVSKRSFEREVIGGDIGSTTAILDLNAAEFLPI